VTAIDQVDPLILPRRRRGRQTAAANEAYREERVAFCQAILEIRSTLDFEVSSRGWAYIFENRGTITKDDLDACQTLINDCRKDGSLPLDICATDETRAFENLEHVEDTTPEEEARWIIDRVGQAHLNYRPESFWERQTYYVQMVVEKIDLRSLFSPICAEFHVPIANAKGWSDLNLRADMMRRFREWEAKGKRCVLLYCGDFDPAGLNISNFLRSNMEDLGRAVDWYPDSLDIERFGLNLDFIEDNDLTWINNLITSSGSDLANPKHDDHSKHYVRDFLRRYGARKVEANALVVRPEAGRELCRGWPAGSAGDDRERPGSGPQRWPTHAAEPPAACEAERRRAGRRNR